MAKSDSGGLLSLVREDRRAHGSWLKPGFHAIAAHRVGTWRSTLPVLVRKPVSLLYRTAHVLVRNVYGIEIAPTARIGRRVIIPHGGTVVVAPKAVIGDDCILRHNVTIAAARRPGDAPVLERAVSVGTGVVIVGRVTIGDEAEIGPNAVVLSDVPPRATVFVDPGRAVLAPRPAWEEKTRVPGEGERHVRQ
jgi:serine O-acetyltransferase